MAHGDSVSKPNFFSNILLLKKFWKGRVPEAPGDSMALDPPLKHATVYICHWVPTATEKTEHP